MFPCVFAQLRSSAVRDTSLAVTFARTNFMALHPTFRRSDSCFSCGTLKNQALPTWLLSVRIIILGFHLFPKKNEWVHLIGLFNQIVASCFALVEADLGNVSGERSAIALSSYSSGTLSMKSLHDSGQSCLQFFCSTWPGGRLQFNFGRLALKADKPKRPKSQLRLAWNKYSSSNTCPILAKLISAKETSCTCKDCRLRPVFPMFVRTEGHRRKRNPQSRNQK